MKKTLHILSLSRQAGVEVMFINYLKHIKQTDQSFLENNIIFSTSISPFFKKQLKDLGVEFFVAKRRSKYDLSFLKQLKSILNKYDFEVIYGQNFIGNSLATLIGMLNKNVKVICHEHGTAWSAKGYKTLLTYLWTRKCNKIICNSKAAKVLLVKRFKADEKKIRVIYNGVTFIPEKQVTKDKNLLLFVGRLESVKSPETIIAAMPHILKKNPKMKLLMIGDGAKKDELFTLTKKMGIEKNVQFTGYLTEKETQYFMACAALLILPSVREALGNVIIEAAFQKTPTIASNIDGIPEVIKHNETGVLINPTIKIHNEEAPYCVVNPNNNRLIKPRKIEPVILANAVLDLINSSSYERMGIKARENVINKFQMKKYVERINQEIGIDD